MFVCDNGTCHDLGNQCDPIKGCKDQADETFWGSGVLNVDFL